MRAGEPSRAAALAGRLAACGAPLPRRAPTGGAEAPGLNKNIPFARGAAGGLAELYKDFAEFCNEGGARGL